MLVAVRAVVGTLLLALVLSLQGCGKDSVDSTTATTTVVANNITGTTSTTVTTTPGSGPTPEPHPDPNEQKAVDELNDAFSGYDEKNPSSPLGVLIRLADSFEHDWRCNEGCSDKPPGCLSDCRISAALYNNQIVMSGDDMLYAQGTRGGWAYKPAALQTLAKCAYPTDGASDGRVNHGCGCSADTCGNAPCPNACANVDPKTGGKTSADSLIVSRCHCDHVDRDVRKGGCFWKGPQFFNGQGQDEIRNMVQQKVIWQNISRKWYNEVVLEGTTHKELIQKNAGDVIAAFIVPLQAHCGQPCRDGIYRMRDHVMKTYQTSATIPVVGLNVNGGARPFEVMPARPTPGPGPPGPHKPIWPPSHCKVGDVVACPGTNHIPCEGNQCCRDGSICPSAAPEYHSCAKPKAVDCTKASMTVAV